MITTISHLVMSISALTKKYLRHNILMNNNQICSYTDIYIGHIKNLSQFLVSYNDMDTIFIYRPALAHSVVPAHRFRCRPAPWSPSSWISEPPSSIERSGTRSLQIERQAFTFPLLETCASLRVTEVSTFRVDLRLELLRGDFAQVLWLQTPHAHPLGWPSCHRCAQSGGLRHGRLHCKAQSTPWLRVRKTSWCIFMDIFMGQTQHIYCMLTKIRTFPKAAISIHLLVFVIQCVIYSTLCQQLVVMLSVAPSQFDAG